MGINEIKAEALKLRPEVRAYLVRELLASLEGLDETEVERLWLEEATRRDED
ncbi:MAG: addiction module antitoxin RelB, partial [Candidatus Riflebacteria bacterium]|nr:addiction module antitoxin RelB [Candidatus Riflebacteria bacterium]